MVAVDTASVGAKSYNTSNLLYNEFAVFTLAVPFTFKSKSFAVVPILILLAIYKLPFIETSFETDNFEFNDKSPALIIFPVNEGADNGAYVV